MTDDPMIAEMEARWHAKKRSLHRAMESLEEGKVIPSQVGPTKMHAAQQCYRLAVYSLLTNRGDEDVRTWLERALEWTIRWGEGNRSIIRYAVLCTYPEALDRVREQEPTEHTMTDLVLAILDEREELASEAMADLREGDEDTYHPDAATIGQGIIEEDPDRITEGLDGILEKHLPRAKYTKAQYWNSPRGFVCRWACVYAQLATIRGLPPEIDDRFLGVELPIKYISTDPAEQGIEDPPRKIRCDLVPEMFRSEEKLPWR